MHAKAAEDAWLRPPCEWDFNRYNHADRRIYRCRGAHMRCYRQPIAFGGGVTLAVLLFICLPFARRKWQTLLCLLVFSALGVASIGCAGYKVDQPNGGTSIGDYIVTITGSSITVTESTAVTITIN